MNRTLNQYAAVSIATTLTFVFASQTHNFSDAAYKNTVFATLIVCEVIALALIVRVAAIKPLTVLAWWCVAWHLVALGCIAQLEWLLARPETAGPVIGIQAIAYSITFATTPMLMIGTLLALSRGERSRGSKFAVGVSVGVGVAAAATCVLFFLTPR